VGPGIFLPFEQELARALADRRARELGGGPLVRQAVALGTGALLVITAAVSAAAGPITRRLFDGSWLLFAGLLVGLVGLWAAYLSRGAFAGVGQFGAYGIELGVEGGSRLLACAALAAVGLHHVGGYGLALSGAFLVSVLCVAGRLRRFSEPGPAAGWDELARAVGWLALGSLLSQIVVNAGPVAVKLLASPAEAQAAGELLAGLVLARLPLFLFAAVLAALLPRLAGLLGAGDAHGFRAGLVRLLLTVTGLSLLTTALLATAGPEIVHLLYGPRFDLRRADLALLSVATGMFMAATVLSNGLLALQRFRAAAFGWAVGVAALGATLTAGGDLFLRVEWSFAAGSAASLVAFAWLLRRAARGTAGRTLHARGITDVAVGP
jgi:O-antigen/teichoic acid export membrane protein